MNGRAWLVLAGAALVEACGGARAGVSISATDGSIADGIGTSERPASLEGGIDASDLDAPALDVPTVDAPPAEATTDDAPAMEAPVRDAPDAVTADLPTGDASRTCRSSRECSDLGLVCDPVRGACVECVAMNDCPAGQSCAANVCRAQTCTPGSSTCADGRTARVCAADGLSTSALACGSMQTCAGSGMCTDWTCVPGAYGCDASGARRVCNATGLDYAAAPCGSLAHATARCSAGNCVPSCATSFGDCDGVASNGCEVDLGNDPANCSACGRACSVANGTASCSAGACRVAACNTGWGDCDADPGNGCESDLTVLHAHCGRCDRSCPSAQLCISGTCSTPPFFRSCRDVRSLVPGALSGVYTLDPDGTGTMPSFSAYCEMRLAGGGWTLVAVITNGDGISNWSPRGTTWITAAPFGNATSITSNADAKSAAYGAVVADEIAVARAGTPMTLEIQSAAGCLGSRSLLGVMQRNSALGPSCALGCATVHQVAPWIGATCLATGIRFRCRDTGTQTTVGGFTVSNDDNSMITSVRPDLPGCDSANFGLGSTTAATSSPSQSDWDADAAGTPTSTDTVARLVFVR